MRKAGQRLARLRDAHLLEHAERFGARLGGVLALMEADRLADLIADREHRIQRRHWLLEDHRDLRPADVAQRRGIGGCEIDDRAGGPGERETAAEDPAATVL